MGSIVFNRGMRDVAGTKPQRLRLGDWYCEPPTWAKAMEMTAKALLFDVRYRDRLLKNLRSIRGFDVVSAGMHIPRKLESNLYLECNRSANGCLRTIRLLLEAAAFPSGEASVEYTEVPHAETEETNSKQSSTIDNVAPAPSPPKMTGPEPYTAYPKRELFAALAEDRIPDEDFDKLLTLEGTRAILGMTPRHDTPVFSLMPQRFFWRDPATRRGKTVFVTAQWFERDKARLDKLLSRWQTNSKGMSVTSPIETNLSNLLQTDFPNGFRPGSVIDRNKFRRLYAQKFGAELLQDFDFESALPSLGVVHDGKVFPVSNSPEQSPDSFVKSLEGRSHGIFFFDALFDAEAGTFTSMGVLSGEMLRTILKKTAPDTYVYGRSFFTLPGSPHTVADAIESAFKVKGEWSREELETFFPYVPADMLVSVLAQDDRFVRVAEGTYRLLSGILLDEDECRQVAMMAAEEVSRTGFFTMTADLFKRSLERNGDVSPSAIQTAFFGRFLSDRFDRHGKVVCVKDAPFDSKMAIRAFCRDNDEVTMEELLQLEQEFGLGGGNRSISAAHEEMVRVSEEKFAAPHFVPFDVAAIDAALESLVPPSGVLPLLSVRSFVSFPAISGLEWNVYLLEAFLRRESASFAYFSVSAAPRTACGAIVRRSAGFATVTDALARAVVEAGVDSTEAAVGDFLMAQGYIQRRRGVEKDVAEAARRISIGSTGNMEGVVP